MKRDSRRSLSLSLQGALGVGFAMVLAWSGARGAVASPSMETANEVTGVRILEPGKWGSVRSVVANRSESESTPLLLVEFSSDPLRQFGSRIWMPAWSSREVLTPVLPGSQGEAARSIEMASRLLGPDGMQRGSQDTALAPFTSGRFDTAIVALEDDTGTQSLVAALRSAAGLKPTTFLLDPRKLPVTAAGYEAIDSLFLSGRDLDLDPLRREAIVGFLERGGRLWVVLEGGDQSWPRELLGDRWNISVVDSIEVTRFVIKGPSGESAQEFDHGVGLVRIVAPGFEVTHTVEGNPAALRKSVGRGQLIVTALAARGWLEPGGAPTSALADLQSVVAPADDQRMFGPTDMRVFDPFIAREIGHEILRRGTVMLILGLAALAVIGAAFWASRAERLELAAPAIAFFALLSGGILLGLGRAAQSDTASTSASAQLVLFNGLPGRAEVFARTSVYLSPGDNGSRGSVHATRGGTVVADRTGSGAIERVVWTDPETFDMEGLDLRSGATTTFNTHLSAGDLGPARATIGLDANGIRGTLSLGNDGRGTWRDRPVLVTGSGIETLEVDGAGALRQTVDGTLGSSAVQSEEQISRQQTLRELLNTAWYPGGPVVLVWSDLVKTGVRLPAPEKGGSLRAIPVEFEAPAFGSDVAIPAVLMTVEPLRREIDGRKVGSVYDPLKRAWLGEVHQPMLVMMQFRPPEALGRIDVRSARLTFDLRAPGRRFDVLVGRAGKLRIAGGGVNPSGRTVVDLSGDNAPEMDADGRVLVGIEVHGSEANSDEPGWSLQRMELSVRGETR